MVEIKNNESYETQGKLMMILAKSGHLWDLQMTVSRQNADVNYTADFNENLLMVASGKGQLSIAQYLINCGVEKDAVTTGGWTALMYAAVSGQNYVVEYLLSIGADKDKVSVNGDTALSLAKKHCHFEAIELLKGE